MMKIVMNVFYCNRTQSKLGRIGVFELDRFFGGSGPRRGELRQMCLHFRGAFRFGQAGTFGSTL
jgi:hypothetical protein